MLTSVRSSASRQIPNHALPAFGKASPRSAKAVASKPPFAIVDGLNLIRYFGKEQPRLEVLLTIAGWLYRDGWDFLCISDANTKYELFSKQSRRASLVYTELLRRYPQFFGECPARCAADPFILSEAEERDAVAISNDKFEPYSGQHKWLADKNRRMPVAIFRQNLYLGHEGDTRLRLDENFESAVSDFLTLLEP